MSGREVRRYVDDLLRGRPPTPFSADDTEAAELRTAIVLRAARPGSGAPSEDFVTGLHRRLAAELADTEVPDTEVADTEPDAPGGASAGGTRRRRFIQGGAIAASTAAVGAVLDHTLTGNPPADPTAAPTAATLIPNTGTWRAVAASAELPEGGVRAFDLGSVAGFVHRSNGALAAVSGSCTHQGCRLALNTEARRLDCPCHSTTFAVTGQLVTHQLPVPPRSLPHFEVREVDGSIEVFAPSTPA